MLIRIFLILLMTSVIALSVFEISNTTVEAATNKAKANMALIDSYTRR